MDPYVVVRSVQGEHFTQEITSGKHRLFADKQESFGGADRGPGPYGYLLAALGSWISITLRMYAERKNIALESVQVELSHQRITAEDCADCKGSERQAGMLDEIDCKVHLIGDLDEFQHDRLLEIARRCPVHRTLTGVVKIRTLEV